MATGLPGLTNDAIASSHFSFEVDSIPFAQIKEVTGVNMECDIITLKENTTTGKQVIKQLPGARKPPTITLKRFKNISLDFAKWHKDAADGKVGAVRKNASLVLYDFDYKEVARYNLTNVWPSKVSMSNANADGKDLITEEVALTCETIERVK